MNDETKPRTGKYIAPGSEYERLLALREEAMRERDKAMKLARSMARGFLGDIADVEGQPVLE